MSLQIIVCLLQSNTPHLYTALESQAASFSHYISLFDVAAFKLNSSLQFKGGPTPANIKEVIKHNAVSKRIIIDLYTHKHTHTYTMLWSINREDCCPFSSNLLWADDILQLLKHVLPQHWEEDTAWQRRRCRRRQGSNRALPDGAFPSAG